MDILQTAWQLVASAILVAFGLALSSILAFFTLHMLRDVRGILRRGDDDGD